MPYRNIHWIKLELRLLDDHRFYLMSERAQLVFIKLILVAGRCKNRILKSKISLNHQLKTNYTDKEMDEVFKEIRVSFPKVLENNGFYSIKGFEKRINPVYSKGYAGDIPEEYPADIQDKIREDKNKIRGTLTRFSLKYQEKTGKPYIPSYAKDCTILKKLGLVIDEGEMVDLIDRFFASNDPFIQRAGYTIGVFKSMINRLRIPEKAEVRYE